MRVFELVNMIIRRQVISCHRPNRHEGYTELLSCIPGVYFCACGKTVYQPQGIKRCAWCERRVDFRLIGKGATVQSILRLMWEYSLPEECDKRGNTVYNDFNWDLVEFMRDRVRPVRCRNCSYIYALGNKEFKKCPRCKTKKDPRVFI